MEDDRNDTDLKHEFLEFKIEKISDDVKLNLSGFRTEMRAEFEVINIRLDGFSKFVKTAEHEIKNLKEDTAFIRASKKWKWVVGLAIVGLITSVNFEQIKAWLSKLNPW